MENFWLSKRDWNATQSLLVQREKHRRKIRTNPIHFREAVKIADAEQQVRQLPQLIEPWQAADFAALDPAWRQLAGQQVKVPYQRAYIERPRGHSKTADMALQLAWILLFGRANLVGLAAAADTEQAGLIREALLRLATWNEELFSGLEFLSRAVRNRKTNSRLKIISSDVTSSWGALPDFVICDELCHWQKPDLWYSLLSSAAKKPDCVLAVLTNAGVGRDWQWTAREAARTSEQWYFSTLDGAQAPWIRQEWLEEQKLLLPGPVYERLWMNRWQHSDGEFLTLEEAEACCDENLCPQTKGQPHREYIAAIDYAEKRDLTAAVLLHREGEVLVVDRMDVVRPTPERPTRVQWVDDWIERIAAAFHRVTFIVDPYQLVGTTQRYEGRYRICRFEFAGGHGNHALAVALRKTILHREVRWYPGCGQIEWMNERDDLETELSSLLLKHMPSGRVRIDHHLDQIHHDDRSFALGAAVLYALEEAGGMEWLEIENPGW